MNFIELLFTFWSYSVLFSGDSALFYKIGCKGTAFFQSLQVCAHKFGFYPPTFKFI